MPEKWTGDLIGKMHNNRITYQELAEEAGITKAYLSMMLNGARNPAKAEEKLNEALSRILERRSNDSEADGSHPGIAAEN